MAVQDVLALEQDSPHTWGAAKDYDTWTEARESEHVFVHWGGSPVRDPAARGNVQSERAQLRAWESYHVNNKGWKGLAYDWAVGNSGRLYRIRGASRSAATSGDVDQDGISNNVEGDAVVVLVGSGQQASDAALATLKTVLDTFDKPVFGHKEAKGLATACPGGQLMQWLGGYRTGAPDSGEVPEPVGGKENNAETDEAPEDKPEDDEQGDDIVAKLPLLKPPKSNGHIQSRGQHVRIVQDLLGLYGSPVNIDGIYGPETTRGVRSVQGKLGAVKDGYVGPETWSKLLHV